MNARSNLLAVLSMLALSPAGASETEKISDPWASYVQSQATLQSKEVVQERLIEPTGRFQFGLNIGTSERRDFTVTTVVSSRIRYHFTNTLAWEIANVSISQARDSALLKELKQKNTAPDFQESRLQLSSSVVVSPIYGKYAWFNQSLTHFDVYGKAGLGARQADDVQPYALAGIGMNNYLAWNRLSVGPEYELRMYSEKRTESVTVFESVFQLGASWLF